MWWRAVTAPGFRLHPRLLDRSERRARTRLRRLGEPG